MSTDASTHSRRNPIHADNSVHTYSSATSMTDSPPGPSRSLSRSLSGTAPAPIPTSRNNPLSLRIYKAIGTTFDDPASRQALEIASSLYSGKGKAREIGHADGGDSNEAVDGEGSSSRRAGKGESAALARKWLKRDVESRLATSSQRFLEAFGEVDKVDTFSVSGYTQALTAETGRAAGTYERDASQVRPSASGIGSSEQRDKVSLGTCRRVEVSEVSSISTLRWQSKLKSQGISTA